MSRDEAGTWERRRHAEEQRAPGCAVWTTSSRTCSMVDADNATAAAPRQRCVQRRTMWRQCAGREPEQVHSEEQVSEEPLDLRPFMGGPMQEQREWSREMTLDMAPGDALESAQQALGMARNMMRLFESFGWAGPQDSLLQELERSLGVPAEERALQRPPSRRSQASAAVSRSCSACCAGGPPRRRNSRSSSSAGAAPAAEGRRTRTSSRTSRRLDDKGRKERRGPAAARGESVARSPHPRACAVVGRRRVSQAALPHHFGKGWEGAAASTRCKPSQ